MIFIYDQELNDSSFHPYSWAKIQEWNRKWNRILATIFCILCFILLFAIVIVNIMHRDESSYDRKTDETSFNPTNFKVAPTVPPKQCYLVEDVCSVDCNKGYIDHFVNEFNTLIEVKAFKMFS